MLFVCVENAGRSQMAAALLEHHAGGRVRVRSAGSEPADAVNPVAVEAMRELGLEIGGAVPRRLETDAVREADVVVTMGCGDACPVFPESDTRTGARRPRRQGSGHSAGIRDEIDARVRTLLERLLSWEANTP